LSQTQSFTNHRWFFAPLIVAAALFQAGPGLAQSPMRGKLLFLRCASCHNIDDTASTKIGPNLKGVIGRRAGSLPGYNYSVAMRSQTFIWDEDTLDKWLTKPAALVPGTAMAFGGAPNKADREAIIEYLRDAAH